MQSERRLRKRGERQVVENESSPRFTVPDFGSSSCDVLAHAIGGQPIQKIGIATGSTTGTITDTCCDSKSGNFGFLCQDIMEINAALGDSGSPVFTWSSATLPQGAKPTATLYGILWGGNSDGEVAYSPINFIEAELGFLRTNWLESGANSAPAVAILSPTDNATVGSGGLALETYQAGLSPSHRTATAGDGWCRHLFPNGSSKSDRYAGSWNTTSS